MAESHRVNYSEEAEQMVSKLYKEYMESSYAFETMVSHFSSADQGLRGFAAWADWMSFRLWVMGRRLLSYQALRGGKMNFEDISKPKQQNWGKAPNAFNSALECVKQMSQCAQAVTKKAIEQGDAHLCHFIDSHIINELTVSLKFIAEGVNQLKDADCQTIYHYDQRLLHCVERLYAGHQQQVAGIFRVGEEICPITSETSNVFTPVRRQVNPQQGYTTLMQNLLQ